MSIQTGIEAQIRSSNKPKLSQMIDSKASSKHHLDSLDACQFIKLCYNHQQIASSFGKSKSCRKPCLSCTSCQKHGSRDDSHIYVDARQFISSVSYVKQKYREYHKLYIHETIPIFLDRLKNTVLQFMRGLQKWNGSTLLLNNFMYFCKNKRVHNLLCTQISEWDFNQFTCSDLWDLQDVVAKLREWDQASIKTDIWNDLQLLLKKSLAYCGINLELTQALKDQEVIKGSIDEIIKQIKNMQAKLQKQINHGVSNTSKLTMELTQSIIALQQNYIKTMQKLEKQKSLTTYLKQPQGMAKADVLAQIQQEQNAKLATMVDLWQEYLSKSHHKTVKFVLRVPIEYTDFWDFFLQKLISLVVSFQGSTQIYHVICPDSNQVLQMFKQAVGSLQFETLQSDSCIKKQDKDSLALGDVNNQKASKKLEKIKFKNKEFIFENLSNNS